MQHGLTRILTLATGVLLAGALSAVADTFELTILHSNDGESQLIDAGSGLEEFGGVARFATKLRELRGVAMTPLRPDAQGVLVVTSGDNFLAGPEFSASLEHGVPYYDTMAYDRMSYHAMAIGNHDFDFGPDVLADFIDGFMMGQSSSVLFDVPRFVSCNLDFSQEPRLQALVDAGIIVPRTVATIGGQQVGIVGATTPKLPYISSPRNVQVDPDVVGAVQAQVDALASAGIDMIVLISHLQSILEDIDLLGQLTGIDIAVAGGGDELLANPDDLLIPGHETLVYGPYPIVAQDATGRDVPVVTTSGEYNYVGRLVVTFDEFGEIIAVDETLSGPQRVAGGTQPDAVVPDGPIQFRVTDVVTAYVANLDQTVVAYSEVDLDGIRANIRTIETNQGNLIADALKWQATELAAAYGQPVPDVALQNGGGIRNNAIVPAGDLTLLDTYNMLPFANFVCIVPSIPAEQFKEILENCVSRVEFVDGRFAQISGMTMVWDPAGTAQQLDAQGNVTVAGTRVLEVTLDGGAQIVTGGAVVPGAPEITIATIDFLARGGDQYPYRDAEFTTVGVVYQQALANYLEEGLSGLVTAAQYPLGGEGRITRFAPPPTPRQGGVATAAGLSLSLDTAAPMALSFRLPADGDVLFTLHDATGRRVATLVNGWQSAGEHQIGLAAGAAAPGVYFARLQANGAVQSGKLVVVR